MTIEELAVSNARMWETLKACRKWVSAPHPETAAGSINKPRFEADMKLVEDALAETPAQSLAAITAPLEARIAELESELQKIAWHLPTVCYEQSEERYVNIEEVFSLKRMAADLLVRTPKQSLATIQDAALKDDALWDQHAVRCGNCACEMIVRKGHALSDPDGSEDEALCGRCAGAQMYIYMDRIDELESEEHRKTIQDAARAEEREACARILDKIAANFHLPTECRTLARLAAGAIRNRANGGEAK